MVVDKTVEENAHDLHVPLFKEAYYNYSHGYTATCVLTAHQYIKVGLGYPKHRYFFYSALP